VADLFAIDDMDFFSAFRASGYGVVLSGVMLNWLRDNAYLAAWLAIPVAILIAVFQNVRIGIEKFDWSRNLLYLAFLVSLAVKFTPYANQRMRDDAGYLVAMLVAFLIIDRKPR
jgi:hypothetical protein